MSYNKSHLSLRVFCSVISFLGKKVKTFIYLCDLVFRKNNFKISDLIVINFSLQMEREKMGNLSTTEIARVTNLCFVLG